MQVWQVGLILSHLGYDLPQSTYMIYLQCVASTTSNIEPATYSKYKKDETEIRKFGYFDSYRSLNIMEIVIPNTYY